MQALWLPEHGVDALDIFFRGINVGPDTAGWVSEPHLAMTRASLPLVRALCPFEWNYMDQYLSSADYRPGVFSEHRPDQVGVQKSALEAGTKRNDRGGQATAQLHYFGQVLSVKKGTATNARRNFGNASRASMHAPGSSLQNTLLVEGKHDWVPDAGNLDLHLFHGQLVV